MKYECVCVCVFSNWTIENTQQNNKWINVFQNGFWFHEKTMNEWLLCKSIKSLNKWAKASDICILMVAKPWKKFHGIYLDIIF